MKKYCKCNFKKYKKEKNKQWKQFGMLCLVLVVLLWTSPELLAFADTPTPTPVPVEEPNWLEFQPVMIMRYIASLFLAYISFKGAIQLGNNVSEYSKAMKNNDDASKQSALDGIFGGGIQFFISGLLAILGITI